MKIRLDVLVSQKYPSLSRRVAHDLIEEGNVTVDEVIINKPSREVEESSKIVIAEFPKYVGRAGLKLEKALDEFNIDPKGLICLDVGASTGGFTDCLIQRKAKHVYAVEVGTGQLAEKLKNNPYVTSMEQTNIRDVDELPEEIDLAVIDVSFVSLYKILPSVIPLLKENATVIALIKPQFEAGKRMARGGVIKDEVIRMQVVNNVKRKAEELGFSVKGVIDSPITGVEGNHEYLMHLVIANSK